MFAFFGGGNSGSGYPITTAGDLIVGDATGKAVRFAKGADNAVMAIDATTHLEAWKSITLAMLPTFDKIRYKSGSPQTLTNNTLTIINYDTLDYDTNTLVTVGAAWKFTAKAAGKYRVSAAAYLDNTTYAVGNQAELFLYKNGVAYSVLARPELQVAGTYRVGLSGNDTVTLAVNDTIDIRAEVFLNAGNSLLQNSSIFNYVSIELML